jgi:hypothetical protein
MRTLAHSGTTTLIVCISIILFGCATNLTVVNEQTISFEIGKNPYKVKSFLDTAIALQSMGQAEACKYMLSVAQKNSEADQIAILCRMLFRARVFGDFRRPEIGLPSLAGCTRMNDWPMEPIEVVDGTPFLIAKGYAVFGTKGSQEIYLRYCIENCEWNTYRFHKKTDSELKAALNKLIHSPKWNCPLQDEDVKFFTNQIQ